MLVTIVVFWVLALITFVVTQWVAPALYGNSSPSPTSGFDYAHSFGIPLVTAWGKWVALFLVILGPLAAAWRAVERGGDLVMGKALGTSRRRGRR